MTFRAGRLLIIKAVRPAEAQWKADAAQCGSSQDHPEPAEPTLTIIARGMTLEFVSGHGHHVTLRLVRPNVLEGTQTVSGGYSVRLQLDRKL
jgi:hypothetical protein